MLRTHNCGELRLDHINQEVVLCGWIQRIRDKGGMIWVDLRDRYGITQLIFEEGKSPESLLEEVRKLGREFVISASGILQERVSKNKNIPTGDIEVSVKEIRILNPSKVPPFLIEDETDGGEDLRMKYRYLDLRRKPLQENLKLRHQLLTLSRQYLNEQKFTEIETPFLIKSTPEGARDFVVPSREHPGEFYALPQSPQTFKQLLMVSGFDQYYQIVKCFRDEDLRADRQPEFTQIDCEMSFVERDDVLQTFEGLIKFLFKTLKGIDLPEFPRISYDEAMKKYGTDKPDLRFGFEFSELNHVVQGKGFNVFDKAEFVAGICIDGCADYSRKQLDELTEFVRKPQVGAKGLVYLKYNEDSTYKSSVDKFFFADDFDIWVREFNAKPGSLILILAGEKQHTLYALSELRLEMGERLGLRSNEIFSPLWVVDFPLMEWDKENKRYFAMHHPFTSPKTDDIELLESNPGEVKANSYDMVINGVELGGGSIRIHNRDLQQKMLKVLGFSKEEAEKQFGFLMQAFEYGTPPHGGIAFGFDRLCALFGGTDSIRDFIAFPKNNAGRDVMIDTPSKISNEQLKELHLKV